MTSPGARSEFSSSRSLGHVTSRTTTDEKWFCHDFGAYAEISPSQEGELEVGGLHNYGRDSAAQSAWPTGLSLMDLGMSLLTTGNLSGPSRSP